MAVLRSASSPQPSLQRPSDASIAGVIIPAVMKLEKIGRYRLGDKIGAGAMGGSALRSLGTVSPGKEEA